MNGEDENFSTLTVHEEQTLPSVSQSLHKILILRITKTDLNSLGNNGARCRQVSGVKTWRTVDVRLALPKLTAIP